MGKMPSIVCTQFPLRGSVHISAYESLSHRKLNKWRLNSIDMSFDLIPALQTKFEPLSLTDYSANDI